VSWRALSPVLRDMTNHFTKVINARIVTVQHPKRLAIVHPHSDAHSRRAIFVDDPCHFETIHLCADNAVLNDRVGAGCAKRLHEPEMSSRRFTALGMSSG
jgi:hypothetical protein